MSRTYKKSITLTDVSLEQLEWLTRKRGYLSTSEAIRDAIRFIYDAKDPSYLRGKNANKEMTPAEAAQRKIEIQRAETKAKDDANYAEDVRICTELAEGKVKGRNCVYFTYRLQSRSEKSVPLIMMFEDVTETIYDGRKRIMELRREGKVDYPLEGLPIDKM